MPHNSSKGRDSKDRTSERSSGTEQRSLVSEHAPEYTAHGRQRGGSQIPFYDDPNHVAYGWQQMTMLPDVFNLAKGSPVDPPLSPWTRPQTWSVEQQDDNKEAEPSGFNLGPEHRQGPRRPRPLPLPEGGVQHGYEATPRFKPFVDVAAEQDDVGAGANDDRDRPASSVLSSKDVNQKFRNDQSQALPSKLTKNRRGMSRLRSKRLIVDEFENTQQAKGEAEYMSPLAEEPAPLQFRKRHADRTSAETSSTEQARMLRAEREGDSPVEAGCGVGIAPLTSTTTGAAQSASDSDYSRKCTTVTVRELSGAENEEMEGLMAAITEQISAFTVEPDVQFEHRSAIPKPLNLGAIHAAKEKRRLARTETESSDKAGGCTQSQGKCASVDSIAPSTSSEFETLILPDNSAHNGARRKWYKGFRRSE